LAGAVQPEVVRDNDAVDDCLTETPTGFDHALIGARDRVLSKHYPGSGGVEKCLHDHADAWPGEKADTLAVRDGRIGICRPPDFANGAGDIGSRMDVEQREMLSGKARLGAVFINSRRSDGKWGGQGSNGLGQFFNGPVVDRCDGLDQVARQRHARRYWKALARGIAESHSLGSKE
jgi:hypothetical protein